MRSLKKDARGEDWHRALQETNAGLKKAHVDLDCARAHILRVKRQENWHHKKHWQGVHAFLGKGTLRNGRFRNLLEDKLSISISTQMPS